MDLDDSTPTKPGGLDATGAITVTPDSFDHSIVPNVSLMKQQVNAVAVNASPRIETEAANEIFNKEEEQSIDCL